MDKTLIITLALKKEGNQFSVMPEERFLDQDRTEKSRWIFSEKCYFDTLEAAIEYIKANSDRLIS